MNIRLFRKLIALPILVLLVAGLLYGNFARPLPASLPASGPQLLGMENEEIALPGQTLTEPLSYDINGPIVEQSAKPASFDGDVSNLPQIGPAEKKPMREMFSPGTPGDAASDADAIDPVAQTEFGPLAMPGYSVSFKGLDLQNWGAGWPPDTHGDVGPNHYIQVVNTSIGIFNKSGTCLAAFTFNTLFTGTGTPCDANNNGDPIALYDQISGRWILTDFAWSSTRGPFYECIAVSKTADPVSGGWWFYALQASSTQLNDYPKLGIWSDGIYMSANMFRRAQTYSGVKVWALNRDDMINGQPLRTVAFTLGTAYFSLLPSNLKGALPPSGTPNYFLSDYGSNTSLKLWKFSVNWSSPSNSTFTGPTSFSVASFTRPSSRVPQQGTTMTLDTLGDRLMSNLQFRYINGVQSLWVSRTVVSGGVTGIRWFEIRNPNGTPSTYQQGTYQPDTTYRWMPSLAVDQKGNMAVGYSVSSSSMYPAIRYAGRLAGDPLGQLSQGEATLIAGTGSQTTYNRWGDYASMTVDPVNDCTFWFTTEYLDTTGTNWQTRVGAFTFPGCP